MKRIFTIMLLSTILASCGLEEPEKEPQEIKKPIERNEDQPKYQTINIYRNEPLEDRLYLANVKEGDEILIEIKGHYMEPLFSKVYVKKTKSTWQKKMCFPDRWARLCEWVTRTGGCYSKFRDHKGKLKGKVRFVKNALDSRIKYFVGEDAFFLPPNQSNNEMVYKTTIKIKKEMLNDSNEIYLGGLDKLKKGRMKVGFLGFNRCSGKGKRKFNPRVNTTNRMVDIVKDFNFFTTVSIRYLQSFE